MTTTQDSTGGDGRMGCGSHFYAYDSTPTDTRQAVDAARKRVASFFRHKTYDPADWGSGEDSCSQPYYAPVEGALESLGTLVAAVRADERARRNTEDQANQKLSKIPTDARVAAAKEAIITDAMFYATRTALLRLALDELIDLVRSERDEPLG